MTAADMEMLRGKKILLVSRSFGLNLFKGLTALAREDKKFDLLSSYQRFDVFKAGGDVGIIPADALQKTNFVHFLRTYWPHPKRLEEMDHLLRDSPHEFGKSVDAVIVFYHTATPELIEPYAALCGADGGLALRFSQRALHLCDLRIYGAEVYEGKRGVVRVRRKIRERFNGKVPVYDMGAILSDDFRAGHVYCPEYSADPAEVHPNLPAGEAMLARGFLLVLKEAFARPPEAAGATHKSVAPVRQTETLPAGHPDVKAVRAILDANGLALTLVFTGYQGGMHRAGIEPATSCV